MLIISLWWCPVLYSRGYCVHSMMHVCVKYSCGTWDCFFTPLSHGPLNPDLRSGSNPGSTQMCVHTAIIAWRQYVGNLVVEKMAFNEALLLFIFFWLRWRRLRLARARRRRIAAAQSIELAVVVAQWRLTSHVAISAALRLLQGNRLKRRAWAKTRSTSLYQDIHFIS